MEITKINDFADTNVIKTFEYVCVKASQLNTQPGSINFIYSPTTHSPTINAIVSDTTYNLISGSNSIDSDNKISIVFNDNIDFNDSFILLRDITASQWYVMDNLNKTHSPEIENDAVYVAILQPLQDYCDSKRIKIEFSSQPSLSVNITKQFLIQKIFKNSINELYKKPINLSPNWLPIIVNPIDIQEDEARFYFSTFSKLNSVNLRKIKVNALKNVIARESWSSDKNDYEHFFVNIKEILENQQKINSGFANMSETEIKEFKSKVYGGSNSSEYADIEINKMFHNEHLATLGREQIEMLVLMCSTFLKSSFCVDGGFTLTHTFIFPFYFDLVADEQITISSKFFSLQTEYIGGSSFYYLKVSENKNPAKQFGIDFPSIPKILPEVNVNLSYRQIQYDELKYKVFIPTETLEDPYSFLYGDSNVVIENHEHKVKLNKTITNFDFYIMNQNSLVNYIKSSYPGYTISSDTPITITKTNYTVSAISPGGGSENEAQYSTLENLYHKHIIVSDAMMPSSQYEWFKSNSSPTTESFTVNNIPSDLHTDPWVTSFREYTPPSPRARTHIELKWYEIKVNLVIEKIVTTAPSETPLPKKQFVNNLLQNNFVLSSYEYIHSFDEGYKYQVDINHSEKLQIKALIIPERIAFQNLGSSQYRYINIPKVHNMTELNIHFIEETHV